MKFYEVQPALEAGKKITHHNLRGKFISIEKEEANIFGKTLVLTISDHSREIGYSLDMFDLFADDWEIIEDIKEVKVEYKPYFRCPSCDCDNTNFTYYKTGWTCKKCGQVVKLNDQTDNSGKLKTFEIRYKGTWICNIRCNSYESYVGNIPHNFYIKDIYSDTRLMAWGSNHIQVNEIQK